MANSEIEQRFTAVVRAPVYEQVAEQIRAEIFSGRYAPGDPLPTERDLAQIFAASRQSVREAIRALQAEGLVVAGGAPMRATVAIDFGRPARDALGNLLRLKQVGVDDLVDLRCVLETAAVRRAAEHRGAELADAHAAIAEMKDPDLSLEAFDHADLRFHVALASASGNEAMHLVMSALRDAAEAHLLAALSNASGSRKTLDRLIAEHEQILQAAEAGDGENAAALIEAHIRGFYSRGRKVA
jgi:DNA-binding FadR family transcriptional regulator